MNLKSFHPGIVAAGAVLFGLGCDDSADDSATEEVEVVYTCPERETCTEEFCDQVLIPAGQFTMGSDHEPHADSYWPSGDERPTHVVELDTFCIDKYEVSLERYQACVDAEVCTPNGLEYEFPAADTVVNHYPNTCYRDMEPCMQRAVNAKTYWQAEAYCEWMGGRLCTEAEWERVANGPGLEQRKHPWGDEDPTAELVNIPSVGTGFIEDVDICEAGASVEGVFNLAGNVYEWVADRYEYYDVPSDGSVVVNPTNPPISGEEDGVGRGSCFFTEPEHTVAERSTFPLDFDWG